jgi:predicted nucleotidyltransferase component of viral defense system
MSVEIIQQKLLTYQCKTLLDQENALKEIAQEIALMALSRAGFFRVAAFQGGTALRILYGLERFSEDLDFVLEAPNPHFNWSKYIRNMQEEFSAYGYALEVEERQSEKIIKTAFLKADSTGGMLIIKDLRSNAPKLRIKLEIDTHPPEGSHYELKFLDFPLPYSIKSQDLPSLFASKSHVLLCRDYVKGRDWYDFSWYVAKKTQINFSLLHLALQQAGPWKNKNISVDSIWLIEELSKKIKNIDWPATKKDIARFLRPRELPVLDVWSEEFFLSQVSKLKDYLSP